MTRTLLLPTGVQTTLTEPAILLVAYDVVVDSDGAEPCRHYLASKALVRFNPPQELRAEFDRLLCALGDAMMVVLGMDTVVVPGFDDTISHAKQTDDQEL